MARSDVTTAVVVDWPTPFAPPVVVNPQLEPIMAISAPKQNPLMGALHKSQVVKNPWTESKRLYGEFRIGRLR